MVFISYKLALKNLKNIRQNKLDDIIKGNKRDEAKEVLIHYFF